MTRNVANVYIIVYKKPLTLFVSQFFANYDCNIVIESQNLFNFVAFCKDYLSFLVKILLVRSVFMRMASML